VIQARLVDRVECMAHADTQALPQAGRNTVTIGGGRAQRTAPYEH
jgi:hypothetical protein